MEARVDTISMYEHLYQNERPERVALQTRAMHSMDLLADGHAAGMLVPLDHRVDQRSRRAPGGQVR